MKLTLEQIFNYSEILNKQSGSLELPARKQWEFRKMAKQFREVYSDCIEKIKEVRQKYSDGNHIPNENLEKINKEVTDYFQLNEEHITAPDLTLNEIIDINEKAGVNISGDLMEVLAQIFPETREQQEKAKSNGKAKKSNKKEAATKE